MYDYIGHLKKFGFKWGINDGSFAFKYEIKIDSSNAKKLIKFFFFIKIYKKSITNWWIKELEYVTYLERKPITFG